MALVFTNRNRLNTCGYYQHNFVEKLQNSIEINITEPFQNDIFTLTVPLF